jgi:hypothetical protein
MERAVIVDIDAVEDLATRLRISESYEVARFTWRVLYCGITLISVELFAEFCGTPISLTPAIWVAIGSIILAVLLLVRLLARYVLHIIGFPIA